MKQMNRMLESFQWEMYTRLTKNKPVLYVPLDEDKTALSEGYRAFVYRSDEIYINLNLCKRTDSIAKYFALDELDQPAEDTRIYLKNLNGTMLHKLSTQDFDVYIDEGLAKGICDNAGCQLYARSPLERVVIQDIVTGNTIGLVMPCRYGEEKNETDKQ